MRLFRKTLAVLTLTVGLLFAALFWPKPIISAVEVLDRDRVTFRVNAQEKKIALTIDDGPHPTIAPLILDVLDKHNAKATFFLIGNNVEGNEEIVARLVEEGHELGNHMLENNFSLRLEVDAFEYQLVEADQILSAYQPDLFWYRPGGGLYNDQMLKSVDNLDYDVVIGSVYPYDANISEHLGGQQFIESFILRNAQPGDIIILHDGMIRTVRVLETVIPELIDKGYEFATLSELFEHSMEP